MKRRSCKLIKVYAAKLSNVIDEIKNFINNIAHALTSIDLTNYINIKLN